MDLMTLAAKIELDDSSYRKGVSNAEKMGKNLAGKMSAATVAVGNLAADMVRKGISAINGVVSGAIDGYADYQQLIGGVETLFKTSADKVSKYAKQSYKTTGLSANDYMQTVTSFSASLLKGLGGDTEKAADLADMAITDMADNANKMGTDIGSIQAAYQGFAKQNYTMLDNLKLGYGGTASEMVKLINDSKILDHEIKDLDGITFDQLVLAIHEVQKNLDITGTTAKEAKDTLSGSKASLKAAWSDLLSAVGGEGDQARMNEALENFKSSFDTYVKNFVPSLVDTIGNSGSLVTAIADSIGNLPTTLLSDIGKEAMTSGAEMIRGVGTVVNWLIDSVVNMFNSAAADSKAVVDLGKAIGEFLGSAIANIVTNVPQLITDIIEVGKSLAEGLAQGLFQGLFETNDVDKVINEMEDSLSDAEYAATQSGAIISYMQKLVDKYGEAAKNTTEWKEAAMELEEYQPGAAEVIDNLGRSAQSTVNMLDRMAERMRKAAISAALTKALEDSYDLLAKQTIEYEKQKARYDRNESKIDDAMVAIREGIVETAKRQAKDMEKSREHGGPFDENIYAQLQDYIKGGTGDGEGGLLKDATMEQLQGIVRWLDDADLNKSLEDEQLMIAQAQEEMKQAKSAMEDTAKEIEATKTEIQDVEKAVEAASKELGAAYDTSAKDIQTGGLKVANALDEVAVRLAGFRIPGISYMPEATGVDYVPYNGFRAELHRGETILTRAEADRYRNGAGTAEVVGAIQSLNSNIQNMQLVVGRKTFGRAVVGYGGNGMNNYIGRAESRRSSGYGT